MLKCQKCGASVGEEKAFCQDCGSPMTPDSSAHRPPPITDFGATIIVPRGPAASGPLPPTPARPPKEANPAQAPGAQPQPTVEVAAVNSSSHSSPTIAPRPNSRTLYIVLGVAAVLLFLLVVIGLLLWLTN